jgi:hypothetical protein
VSIFCLPDNSGTIIWLFSVIALIFVHFSNVKNAHAYGMSIKSPDSQYLIDISENRRPKTKVYSM